MENEPCVNMKREAAKLRWAGGGGGRSALFSVSVSLK
jgi:hypothetical protein